MSVNFEVVLEQLTKQSSTTWRLDVGGVGGRKHDRGWSFYVQWIFVSRFGQSGAGDVGVVVVWSVGDLRRDRIWCARVSVALVGWRIPIPQPILPSVDRVFSGLDFIDCWVYGTHRIGRKRGCHLRRGQARSAY